MFCPCTEIKEEEDKKQHLGEYIKNIDSKAVCKSKIKRGKERFSQGDAGTQWFSAMRLCTTTKVKKKNKKGILGKILALTYTDKLDNETLNELTALGFNIAKKYRINLKNKHNSFWSKLLSCPLYRRDQN